MSSDRLSPVSYLVLGLVATGAATSYDLKAKVARSVGYMWSFPHSGLYAEPARLVRLGLLDERREESGRRRRVYTITRRGRQALVEWLGVPTSELSQLRDLGLIKLFFADLLTTQKVVALANAQEQAHRERLSTYKLLDSKIPRISSNTFPRATLRMGLRIEQAFVEFWQEVAQEVAEHPPSVEPRGKDGR